MIPATSAAWRARGPVRLGRIPLARIHPAVRLAGVLLLITSAMLADAWTLLGLGLAIGAWLHAAGLRWSRLPTLLRPWLWFGLGLLIIHTLTAADVAPLGQPTREGLERGALVLARLAVVLGGVAAAGRSFAIDDLVTALAWWLRPLRRCGLDATSLGLGVAVAMGTVPQVRSEGARLLACQRLRRTPSRTTPWRWLRMRLQVIPPLIDWLLRRAESLPLVVAWRLPAEAPSIAAPPSWQWLPLVAWLLALVWLA